MKKSAFDRSAEVAVSRDRHAEFIRSQVHTDVFWHWINDRDTAINLVLALADNEAFSPYIERLAPHRQVALQDYRLLRNFEPTGRGATVMRMVDKIRLRDANASPREGTAVVGAIKAVLESTTIEKLNDQAQEALFIYYFLLAGKFVDVSEALVLAIGNNPRILEDREFLSVAASVYGTRILELIAAAIFRYSANAQPLANILHSLTAQDQFGQDPTQYAKAILKWSESQAGRIEIDTGALYPAPPFLPLFRVK